ncbi:unnamed protein product [Chironomus riparius]|uniref:C-type lectin domain-containing protein n=1 Tax=Chironomus riparius TaxID=315576 RepID=A0A9N9RY18_9DIPT|nr:unnamed protein product [Chironomus riparius]
MLKALLIIFVQILISSCDDSFTSANLSLIPVNSAISENIGFLELGKYRGFTDDGAEYQKTYFVSKYSRPSWAASRSFCNSFNMEHLTIETKAEEQAYLNLLETNIYLRRFSGFYIWLDGLVEDPKSKTEWFWAKTGIKVSFPITWHPIEPNNEYCLVIFRHTINEKFLFGTGECNTKRWSGCQKIDLLVP